MTAQVCFTMDNLGDAADLGRGVISQPRPPGERPALEQGFPALLDLYRRFNITITHFLEGWAAETYPEYIAMDLKDGHRLGMHGWQHELWSSLEYNKAQDIASMATEAIRKNGVEPKAFRAPGVKEPVLPVRSLPTWVTPLIPASVPQDRMAVKYASSPEHSGLPHGNGSAWMPVTGYGRKKKMTAWSMPGARPWMQLQSRASIFFSSGTPMLWASIKAGCKSGKNPGLCLQ